MLLGNNAQKAKDIITSYQPLFSSMEAYFEYVDKLNLDMDAVSYEDGKVTLSYGG